MMNKAPVVLSFGEVEALLCAVHRIAPEGRKAFRSRLQHLQRNGFPPASRVGRHARASYGLDDILKLLTVFSLVDAFVPPVIGMRLLARYWPEVARLAIAAADANTSLSQLPRVPRNAPQVLMLLPRAFATMGGEGREAGRGSVDQGEISIRLLERNSVVLPHGLPTVLVLDFNVIVDDLLSAWGEAGIGRLNQAFSEFADRQGW